MTKIKRMIMHGFKSFAKRTEFIFGDGFNCVIGPNGSGKSNVIDALCFVLGRASSKSLRAEKSANLIYNGGKTKKPAKQGEVSIIFDNSSKIFPINADEIKVTRIIKQNGQSVYKINDKKMTRQQVLELLSHAKINPDGFNIVLQGDIISFVEMSPVDRRKIIEEVGGISIYEEKKQKAVRELEKVEEKLKEAEIVLTERKTHLDELRKERDQALKYKELEDKVKLYKASLLNFKIQKRKNKNESIFSKLNELKQKLSNTQKEIEEEKLKISDLKKQINEINKKIEKEGEENQVKLHKQIETLKIELASSKTKLENYKNEIEKIKDRKSQLNNDLSSNKQSISNLEKEKKDLQKLINQKNKEIKFILDKLEKFKKKHNMEDSNQINEEIQKLDEFIDKKEQEMQKVREKQQELFREKDRLEYQIQTIDNRLKKVKQLENDNKSKINELKNKKQNFKNIILELNQKLNEDSKISKKIGELKRELESQSEQLAKLNAKNIALQEKANAGMAVKSILSLKKKGIYGTISDLGSVSSKYSLALEIAGGSRLNSIVVDNDKIAAECINYLKKNKLGTATFIPLNKIKIPSMRYNTNKLPLEFKKINGVYDFAINLISFDKKFEKAFFYVFGDTLVVEDLETLRKIGVGNARMVTLTGNISEYSGVMKGGFISKKRTGLGFKEKDVLTDISKKEQEISNIRSKLSQLIKERDENEEKISNLRKLKADLEGEIITLEKQLHLETGDVDLDEDEKTNCISKLKEVEKELNNLIMDISKGNREIAQLKIKKQQLRNKLNDVNSPTLLAELNAFEDKKQELRESIIRLETEIKNKDAQISMIQSEINKIQNIFKQHDKELSHFNEQINQLQIKIKENMDLIKKSEEKQKEFYSRYKELFSKRDSYEEKIKESDSKIEALLEVSRKTEISLNTLSLEEARIKAELSGLQKEFEEFSGIELITDKDESDLKSSLSRYKKLLDGMSLVNMKALEIYDKVEQEYHKILDKKEKLSNEKEDVLSLINDIEEKKKNLFLETFNVLNDHFKKKFSLLSAKGEATLLLENEKDPFDGGVRVLVKLTDNKFLDIRSLSGGEKTLTALAFIFAIQEYEPHSFYVMDEVDAALDKANSEKLAKLIKSYINKAQYVVISHNDSVISEAEIIYGLSMNEHGITNVTSLKL